VVVGTATAVVAIVAVVIAIGIDRMVDAAGHIGERAEVIVEGMIFLHYDDDVFEVLQGGVPLEVARRSRPWQEHERKTSRQRDVTGFEFHHGPPS
jgi:hypothetical protein